ncbi:MAG: 1,6-anhydro-N-acetylmuramyl-L-alanine amidase AmpD [Gammaproteobacteria bacterium]|nr:1,6-anhydro-N-acetylmuramyl-L-alanine amidase AmpD [Gammaproteobacteria bacterium]
MERTPARLPPIEVDARTGLLVGARERRSPNCDARPAGASIDLIVVHGISLPPGAFGGPWIDRLFTNTLPREEHPYFAEVCDLRVSAHLLIRRDGDVTQYVRFTDRAWHAGRSSYQGREACNDFSIGIELEGADRIPYDDAQYRVLAQVVAALCAAYPGLSPQRLVGHSDIAPGRKTDPGPAFDWPRTRRLVALALGARTVQPRG